jgi:hypothetical protein
MMDRCFGQEARNFGFHLDERVRPLRFLIHDRDSKFCGPFDEVFAAEDVRVVRTPIRAPRANAISERWIRTVRKECLDWLLILSRRHLEHVLRIYIDQDNPATSPRPATSSTGAGRVREDTASLWRKRASARSTWWAAARIL